MSNQRRIKFGAETKRCVDADFGVAEADCVCIRWYFSIARTMLKDIINVASNAVCALLSFHMHSSDNPCELNTDGVDFDIAEATVFAFICISL